ncbi:MAG: methylated-DNA--[protein]-cysteine S-methyltransferase [Dehalococcoidia bacterium]
MPPRNGSKRRTAAYGAAETSAGPVLVAVCDGRLVALKFGFAQRDTARAVEELHREFGARFGLVADDVGVAPVLKQVRGYLEGRRHRMDVKVDLSSLTPFQRDVLLEVARVPRGKVSTYAEIARRIGRPNAYRAVGNALGNNPVPVVVPCHRVLGSNGIGGFGLGLDVKRRLLALEGVSVD